MIVDTFRYTNDSPMAPSENCFPITPQDGVDLPTATKGIYVGTGGTVTLLSLRGEAPVTFVNVPDGSVLDVRARVVMATGTTASNLIGLG